MAAVCQRQTGVVAARTVKNAISAIFLAKQTFFASALPVLRVESVLQGTGLIFSGFSRGAVTQNTGRSGRLLKTTRFCSITTEGMRHWRWRKG
jgi:hypothetical protein